MSEPQINEIPSQPDLIDLLNLFKRQLMLDFNCVHIGQVEAFNAEQQTATVSISYKMTFYRNAQSGALEPFFRDYPAVVEAPTWFARGGGFSLTFPVKKGDDCLVLFNDRDIDNWFAGSNASELATPRLHSFSDAIVLTGIGSLAKVISAFSTTHAEFRNKAGNASVSVSDDEVFIKFGTNKLTINADKLEATLGSNVAFEITPAGKFVLTKGGDEFVSAIVTLFQDIQSATTATMIGNNPLIMPTFASNLAKLEGFKE